MFDTCKETFEKFFESDEKKVKNQILIKAVDRSAMTKEEREKYDTDFEKAIIFKQKLFGNNLFVGELYRRKLMPQQTLMYIFESLLGMQGFDAKDIDDLVVEGAICLMEKIGLSIEDKVKKSNKDEQKTQLSNIMKRFEQLNSDKCKEISNRVKLLIKNMFANQKSGW